MRVLNSVAQRSSSCDLPPPPSALTDAKSSSPLPFIADRASRNNELAKSFELISQSDLATSMLMKELLEQEDEKMKSSKQLHSYKH